MSTSPNNPSGAPQVGVLVPAAPVVSRHAFGWPPGSIRAVLTLLVVGLVCALVLTPPQRNEPTPIPAYLLYLLFLILGHYFAARGSSPGEQGHAAPLWLPAGTVR